MAITALSMMRSQYWLCFGLFCWSFLAAATGCSRRVDPKDRNGTDGSALGAAEGAVKARNRAELVHVAPNELFATVRQMRQKGVVLNVWATWCAPCREELPMLAKVAKAYKDRGIAVLPLSVDDAESEVKIAEVLGGFGFEPPYYVVKPPIGEMKTALYEGWPGNIPVTFLLEGSAKRRYFFNAEVYENELTPKLDALLSGTLPEGQSNFGVAPGKEL
jgi:thiol-disulfide isomerase/thioredoxin